MTAGVNVDDLTGKFVLIRDKIKALKDKHTEELKPFNEAKDMLSAILMAELDKANVDSMKSASGTIHSSELWTAVVEDADAFRQYVKSTGDWDLADVKANGEASRAFLEEHKFLPPGVRLNSFRKLGVRRASK